ncbi:glutamine synthetase-like [Babylonia areolata]|uniref:glutamine synthetase-like n=1 Tax=Babylonia areolata TaxID=304850 RepID=UPI003FD5089B
MPLTKMTPRALEDYDSIQLMIPDVHSVPRGKVVAADIDSVEKGLELWRGVSMLGPNGGFAPSVPFHTSSFPNHPARPCIETLTPWPWVSTEKRPVGSVLCDVYEPDGKPDLHCPRQQLRAQLDALRKKHGLKIKTAFEYEFFAFKENTLEPLGCDQGRFQFVDLTLWGRHQEMFGDLRDTVESMGITTNTLQSEFPPGQWELTTIPYPGVTGADVGFYVKNAIKGFLKNQGYDATFMTRPTLGSISSGLHMNHSLWKPLAEDGKEENVFVGSDGGLSSTAKHWIAGVLTHADALCALFSPSLNCYRRMHGLTAPHMSNWGVEDRNTCIRARICGNNVYLENRMVGGAASPYLALAANVAAGMDGLDRRLECPPPMDSAQGKELPRTLAQALDALENNDVLRARLGEDFVSDFVDIKRKTEVMPFEKADLKTEEEGIAFERDMYFKLF